MSPFHLSADQQEILDHADRFARKALAPLAEPMDNTETWPDGLFETLGSAGFLGLTAPESLGGAGMDIFSAGLIGQAFSRHNPAVALSWGAHENLALHNLLRNGNDEQRARFIPGMCAGTIVGALGLTEPGAGSDALGSMRTTAIRDGDRYRLNGRKLWITNGPIADVVLVYAKTAPERGPRGISAFLVEKGTPGFSTGQKIRKMGYRGSPTGELIFEDAIVPARNRIGAENAGVSVLMGGLDVERAFLAVTAVGMGERCLELSLDYAQAREQFGAPLASFQLIQAKLADMYVALETIRALVYGVLSAFVGMEKGAAGRGPLHRLAAASILHAGRAYKEIADHAVQLHGGMGFGWEGEINRLYRCAKLMEIGAGTNEVRQIIIAEELLRDAAR
ncbi:MAG: acyl-CoA dehydrogenase family protein [Myxococcota bacterium]